MSKCQKCGCQKESPLDGVTGFREVPRSIGEVFGSLDKMLVHLDTLIAEKSQRELALGYARYEALRGVAEVVRKAVCRAFGEKYEG